LYSGEKGRAAHEMIIDCRDFKEYGIEVKDIAKALSIMDSTPLQFHFQ